MVIKVELICIPFHFLILFIEYLCNLVRSFRWQLSQTIKPSSFTLEHMPASLSQFGDNSIPSAPKDFSVWVSECHSNTENISHNTPCLPPNILHNRSFFFHFSWLLQLSRETEVDAYANVWRANRVYYGRCATKNKLLNNSLCRIVTF